MSYLCTRKTERTNAGAVVQLVRILACHARGRGFESRPHRKSKSVFHGIRFLRLRFLLLMVRRQFSLNQLSSASFFIPQRNGANAIE